MANAKNGTGYRYQTEPCSRCGGGGEYSYCQMHGSRCFKCGGHGVQLTRTAKRAKAKVLALREKTLRRVPAESLVAGQWVLLGDAGNRYRVHLQEDAQVDPVGRWTSKVGNEERSGRYVRLVGQKMTHMVVEGSMVPLALTLAEADAIRAYALTLKGVEAD